MLSSAGPSPPSRLPCTSLFRSVRSRARSRSSRAGARGRCCSSPLTTVAPTTSAITGGLTPSRHACGSLRGAPRSVGDASNRRVSIDRKSTRLNSSHLVISYALFCWAVATLAPSLHVALPICSISRALEEQSRRGTRTVLFVTADHGRAHDFSNHGRAHPESARVWLLAWGTEVGGRRLEPTGEHRSEEHTSELQSPCNLVCSLLLGRRHPRAFPARRSSDLFDLARARGAVAPGHADGAVRHR